MILNHKRKSWTIALWRYCCVAAALRPYNSGSQPFFDGGPNLIFQVSWRATEMSSTFSCLHDGRLRAPSAHMSSFKMIWEVYPVASFKFYKKASQVCLLLSTQRDPRPQVHPTWRAPLVLKPHILPSSLPQPFPTHPAPNLNPIPDMYRFPSTPPCTKTSSLSPLLPHLSSKACSYGCKLPNGICMGRSPSC